MTDRGLSRFVVLGLARSLEVREGGIAVRPFGLRARWSEIDHVRLERQIGTNVFVHLADGRRRTLDALAAPSDEASKLHDRLQAEQPAS